jgi:NAD(P)-dependent dehydrogenase (short-subunit alcohol dehydrogenase family)
MPEPVATPLRDRVVVQFGGTGLLGPALTDALIAAGAITVVASRDPSRLPTPAAGARIEHEAADLGDEAALQALRDRVLARHGRIDGVVYNAKSAPMRAFSDPLETWRQSMEVNATGCFAALRACGDAMAARGTGSIVAIASMQGMIGMNPWLYEGTPMGASPDYFFHKGGMLSLVRYLASHYGSRGVRVNAVSPGGIYNPERPQHPLFLERYAKATMLGRMAEAAEIGGAVVFLLSDAASYITGANLPVDGGYTAK